MTEDENRADDAPAAVQVAPTSFGARLVAAREREGLSAGDMAARLRLHVKQVRALESEDLARLPEAAYVRGFVRSYARSLGLDPAPLIDDLNSKIAPSPDSVVDGMTRPRGDYSPVRDAARERASRSLVLGLSVLALVALGAVGWYATRQTGTAPAAPSAATTAAPSVQPATPGGSPSTPDAGTTERATPAADGQPAVSPTEPAPAPSHPLSEGAALLSLSFSGPSWLEVIDASGKVLVSQVARAGDVFQPVGTPPLAVVIGDASRAAVTVRGEAMNLESSTRANVARFSVK
jgi:cytoskeleton protein RodZ